MAPIKAPYLPYENLRSIAADFLSAHHVSLAAPVPIERIIEYDLGMDIVPMPGLCNMVKDGWISRDLQTIYVDDHFYKSRENRCRFTLAHELSHRLLHADIIRAVEFDTIAEWKAASSRIPADQLRWIEWQADALAGLLLVPPATLESAFTVAVNKAFDAGVDIHEMGAEARRKAFDAPLAVGFAVASTTMTIRLEYDGHVAKRQKG